MADVFLANAMDAAKALLDAVGVPGQVIVDHQVRALQVDAFARRVGGEQDDHIRVIAKTVLDFGALAAATGRTTEELSGVLGGLGRRVNATSGIETLAEAPGVNLLFEHREGAPPGGGWGWAMRPELRQALEDLGLPWE